MGNSRNELRCLFRGETYGTWRGTATQSRIARRGARAQAELGLRRWGEEQLHYAGVCVKC